MERSMIFEATDDDSARFLLGTAGSNPLVCVGVNPSTATPQKLDVTVTKVQKFATLNGHDSWVMLNLYPQRSTDPSGMDDLCDPSLAAENERAIERFVDGRALTVLGAWGGLIETRSYLPGLLRGLVAITNRASCQWRSIGEPIVGGHPRHPSRASYATPLQAFDMSAYLRRLR